MLCMNLPWNLRVTQCGFSSSELFKYPSRTSSQGTGILFRRAQSVHLKAIVSQQTTYSFSAKAFSKQSWILIHASTSDKLCFLDWNDLAFWKESKFIGLSFFVFYIGKRIKPFKCSSSLFSVVSGTRPAETLGSFKRLKTFLFAAAFNWTRFNCCISLLHFIS